MENELKLPETLQEAIIKFSDPIYAHDVAVSLVWQNGPTCPHCGCVDHHFIANWFRFRCRGCKKQYTVKVGTIFEDSPLGLDKWLTAMWMIANCKNGISSYEIHRAIGITQKSAWFVLHRIRVAMTTGTFKKMAGTVEVDETAIGGREKNKHVSKRRGYGTGNTGKAVVQAFLERGDDKKPSKARAIILNDVGGPVMKGNVRAHVESGTNLFTDGARQYQGLNGEYNHEFVDHAVKYVEGQVHTNSLENFFSLLKRSLHGTYVAVDPAHLIAYVDEQTFRFNNRKTNDGTRFQIALSQVAGKRLDYKTLIGKE